MCVNDIPTMAIQAVKSLVSCDIHMNCETATFGSCLDIAKRQHFFIYL